jgi:hypothetical protein
MLKRRLFWFAAWCVLSAHAVLASEAVENWGAMGGLNYMRIRIARLKERSCNLGLGLSGDVRGGSVLPGSLKSGCIRLHRQCGVGENQYQASL